MYREDPVHKLSLYNTHVLSEKKVPTDCVSRNCVKKVFEDASQLQRDGHKRDDQRWGRNRRSEKRWSELEKTPSQRARQRRN